jgi:hypothetical protein
MMSNEPLLGYTAIQLICLRSNVSSQVFTVLDKGRIHFPAVPNAVTVCMVDAESPCMQGVKGNEWL